MLQTVSCSRGFETHGKIADAQRIRNWDVPQASFAHSLIGVSHSISSVMMQQKAFRGTRVALLYLQCTSRMELQHPVRASTTDRGWLGAQIGTLAGPAVPLNLMTLRPRARTTDTCLLSAGP